MPHWRFARVLTDFWRAVPPRPNDERVVVGGIAGVMYLPTKVEVDGGFFPVEDLRPGPDRQSGIVVLGGRPPVRLAGARQYAARRRWPLRRM